MKQTISYINAWQQLWSIWPPITKNTIFWVISVPVICDEMSKEMIKYCAQKAGMKHFELALEHIVSKDLKLRAYDSIMMLNCGAATVDAACIEIESSSYDLSELNHGDGIRAEGLGVDQEFIKLFRQL